MLVPPLSASCDWAPAPDGKPMSFRYSHTNSTSSSAARSRRWRGSTRIVVIQASTGFRGQDRSCRQAESYALAAPRRRYPSPGVGPAESGSWVRRTIPWTTGSDRSVTGGREKLIRMKSITRTRDPACS
jgi:hypothetical protein